MKLPQALLWLVILSLLWMRAAVWLDAAAGPDFGFAFVAGGLLAGTATAGLHRVAGWLEQRSWFWPHSTKGSNDGE